jgi:hypothetical protein
VCSLHFVILLLMILQLSPGFHTFLLNNPCNTSITYHTHLAFPQNDFSCQLIGVTTNHPHQFCLSVLSCPPWPSAIPLQRQQYVIALFNQCDNAFPSSYLPPQSSGPPLQQCQYVTVLGFWSLLEHWRWCRFGKS